ncbi:MAG TPA: ATP-binding protein [Phycisphaerae bacterium]|jgi:serine/threonine-protein kinase RsbW|nr:ATP-binding protein [Phycisphaerae bacterium]HOB73636.1 ATP-binding protein [Phycisphaerae bacterium]HOJ54759.1 ATP-binding protein [Phycisphaerae bacterium]HOL25889.1 ATP-binding protein [Phycisphaerae bacterium]HPP21179.1 ATP-binding protein [Phycisphaerae bacterium]
MRSKRSHDQTGGPVLSHARPLPHQAVIPSDLCAAREIEEEILRQAETCGYSPECGFAIRLALEEAVVNAHKHGNKGDPNKKIVISYRVDPHCVVVRVRDDGPGFDPASLPDCTAPDRIDLPCGRGIMLMNAYMDSVTYNEQGNEVQLIKERC